MGQCGSNSMRRVRCRSYTNKDRKDYAEVETTLKTLVFLTQRLCLPLHVCCGFVGVSSLRHLHSGTGLRENPYLARCWLLFRRK